MKESIQEKYMYRVLEEYRSIYQAEAIGKLQRKKKHQATTEWLYKEYTDMPNLQEAMAFCKANRDIIYVKQFYDKLIFPFICFSEDEYEADALLMLFQNRMAENYAEYLCWKVSILELENIVLEKYPDHKDILEYRYTRQKQWFDYSIHEVPSGVLCDNVGASIENLHKMIRDLTEFRNLCLLLNIDNTGYIRYVSDMYHAYEQYLYNKNCYVNFQDYLDTNAIKYSC